jgi:hypothetical protein
MSDVVQTANALYWKYVADVNHLIDGIPLLRQSSGVF